MNSKNTQLSDDTVSLSILLENWNIPKGICDCTERPNGRSHVLILIFHKRNMNTGELKKIYRNMSFGPSVSFILKTHKQ